MRKLVRIIVIIAILAMGVGAALWILHTEKRQGSGSHGGHGEEAEEHGGHGHEGHSDEHDEADRVELTAKQIENAGMVIEEAGPAKLRLELMLYGRIEANQDRLARVAPRYPGIVREVGKRLGDKVEQDEVLAVVESNESLQPYNVKSRIAGTITAKNITVGEFVTESTTLYTVADLRTVWVDLNVYRQDFDKLREGQKLLIHAGEGIGNIEGEISYLSPFGAENTQSLLARAVVANPRGLLRPGLFVTARVIIDEPEVDVAVKPEAVQTLEEKEVVFVQEGDAFEGRPVKIGRRTNEWVEITSGILPGESYVASNSFMLKAEIGKGAAEHSH